MKRKYDKANELDEDLGFGGDFNESLEREYGIGDKSRVDLDGRNDFGSSLYVKGSSNWNTYIFYDDFGCPKAL